MSENSKPWYLSKGFVGPLVTAILFSLRNLGIADVDTDTALGFLYHGAEFVGIVFGMAGRALAQSKLTLGLAECAPSNLEGRVPRSDGEQGRGGSIK